MIRRCAPAPDVSPLPPVGSADDESVLVFSSGTTGVPKAVRHTHRSMGAATRHWVDALGLGAEDRFQIATPPSHILGLLNLLAAAEAGATVRLHLRFDLDEILRRIPASRSRGKGGGADRAGDGQPPRSRISTCPRCATSCGARRPWRPGGGASHRAYRRAVVVRVRRERSARDSRKSGERTVAVAAGLRRYPAGRSDGPRRVSRRWPGAGFRAGRGDPGPRPVGDGGISSGCSLRGRVRGGLVSHRRRGLDGAAGLDPPPTGPKR